MPTPFVPNELVTQIFDSLYTSLRSNSLYSPISLNSVFAPFTLVDQRWRSLSLPYLVRHYDRPSSSISGFLALIKKHKLKKAVKSIHFAFDIPTPTSFMQSHSDLIEKRYGKKHRKYRAQGQWEIIECKMEEWFEDTFEDTQDFVATERMTKAQKEKKRWEPLVSMCMPHVEEVEVGKKSKEGNFDDTLRNELWKELLCEGDYKGGPGDDVVKFLVGLKGPNVKKLRINLLSGSSIAEIPHSTPSNFPLVQDLSIHHYLGNSDNFLQAAQHPRVPIWKGLHRLSLTNVASHTESFPRNITNSYLRPSSTSLTNLELKMLSRSRYMIVNSQASRQQLFHRVDIFSSISFPLVKEVNLKLRNLPQNEEEAVKQHFPNAKHFSLEVERETNRTPLKCAFTSLFLKPLRLAVFH
ncbi:hypothetical protein JCM5353_006751 [Sporobolomyces roseus]